MKQNKIGFNSDQPFSESMKSFLESHFNQSRFNNSKIKRHFFTIDPKEISTEPSPHSTLNGIMSFHCFRYASKNIMRYRYYPCQCIRCINMEYDHCLNKDQCGIWKDKQFDAMSFPSPNDNSTIATDDMTVLPPIPSLQDVSDTSSHRHHPYNCNVNRQ